MTGFQSPLQNILLVGLIFGLGVVSPANAQEIRYSYLEMSFMGQSVDELGTQTPVPMQTVDYDAKDGAGIKFRGSVGTWNNLYLYIDYGSTDIDLNSVVTNPAGQVFPAKDEFDLTTIRGGVGYKYSIGLKTDIFAEVSYESADLDFGSFALENFDTGEKDFGGALGVRHMLNDEVELRGWARYTNVGDVNLDTLFFDSDTLIGVGFGWEVIRGLSVVGGFESGEFGSYSLGFRLDLDEN